MGGSEKMGVTWGVSLCEKIKKNLWRRTLGVNLPEGVEKGAGLVGTLC